MNIRLNGRGKRARDDEQQRGGDDRHDRIGHGLVLWRLHQRGQAQIEKIKAVKAYQAQDRQRRNQSEDARQPARGRGIGGDLERLHLVLLATEFGRKEVDDEGQLGSGEPEIERHENRAETRRGKHRDEEIGMIERQESDALAAPHAAGGKRGGKPVDAVKQFAVGPRPAFIGKRLAFRTARGALRDPLSHREHCLHSLSPRCVGGRRHACGSHSVRAWRSAARLHRLPFF